MKNRQIINSINKIQPDEVAKKRMLSNILEEAALEPVTKREENIIKLKMYKRFAPIAACFALVMLAAFAIPQMLNMNSTPQIEMMTPVADSPMGIRKTMNYNGHRYAFLENGATFKLNKVEITETLGKLEYDITLDPKNNGSKDFSASFAVGGTIYKIPYYDSAFRVAVELDGNYYICESVDALGDEAVVVSEYFKTANFAGIVKEIRIYDHSERTVLGTVPGKKARQMVAKLAESTPAVLTNDDYKQIGKAQSAGKSFLLYFQLNDKTQYKMYVIPTLGISMIGDNRYTLTDDFVAEYSELFESFKQQPAPMY